MREETRNDDFPDFEDIDWDSELEKIDTEGILENIEIEKQLEIELGKIESLLTRWLQLPHEFELIYKSGDGEESQGYKGKGVGELVVHQYSQWVCENLGFDYDLLDSENKETLSQLLLNCIRQGVAIGIGMGCSN